MKNNHSSRWWGEFQIQRGWQGIWRIGPFHLRAHHRPKEWVLAWHQEGDWLTTGVETRLAAASDDEDDGQLLRVATAGESPRLRLLPRLADRSVVAAPQKPFRLLPGAVVNLFVSTAVWVVVEVDSRPGEEVPREILDVPAWRPADTWFGSPFGVGELCYATRTIVRLNLENVTIRPHRAVTKVRFENRSREVIPFERLSLPVENLSIYAGADHRLWTQEVRTTSDKDGDLAELDVGHGAPPEAGEAELLSGPRKPSGKNVFVRAMNALVS